MKKSLSRSVKILTQAVCIVIIPVGISVAQMNNKPFSFPSSSSGIGMSSGGKQAIVNMKLLGETPRNLLRDSSGALLDVQQGPGRTAVVKYHGTSQTIPQYRGTSFRENRPLMSVGTFNAHFSPYMLKSNSPILANSQKGATVNTWTTRVVSGVPVSYLPNNTVETWTGQVSLIDE